MAIKIPVNILKYIFIFFSVILFAFTAQTQTIWENPKAAVYPFLQRMADKGLIEFNDLIQPVGRKDILILLEELNGKKNNLSKTEIKELSFYYAEYAAAFRQDKDSSLVSLIKNDEFRRWRVLGAKGEGAALYADPLFSLGYIGGSGKAVKQYGSGVDLWGTIGKHWGFQLYIKDFTESGTGYDTVTQNNPQTGIIRKDISNYTSLNYSETRASLSYSWKKGVISIGQDHLLWGYGQNGLIVLSDKSPVFPYIRLDYQLFKWLSFNYDHIWLNSNIIDSNRTYNTGNIVYGGQRTYYQPKFMAMHSINIRFTRGLTGAVGESIIYNDHIQVPYLIPVLFFKLYDYQSSNSNNMSGSNGQFFFNLSSRNQLPKTHLYGTLFIDEISLTDIFNQKKKRNQIGYTAGIERQDCLIPYLSLGLEYTRVNPFVYSNFIPSEDYTSHGYNLGDWMGNNFDRIIAVAKYHPFPKLYLNAHYQYSRKGGAGDVLQQYFAQPQPPFLFDLQNKTKEIYFQLNYEWIHRLYLNFTFTGQQIQYYAPAVSNQSIQTMQLGISYGL